MKESKLNSKKKSRQNKIIRGTFSHSTKHFLFSIAFISLARIFAWRPMNDTVNDSTSLTFGCVLLKLYMKFIVLVFGETT